MNTQEDQPSGFRAGRIMPPFAATPQWVLVAENVSPAAKGLYAMLCGLLAQGEVTTFASRELLASMLGASDRSIKKWADELEALGALEADVQPVKSGRSTVYLVHHQPPDNYNGAQSCWERRAQYYSQNSSSEGVRKNLPDPTAKTPAQKGSGKIFRTHPEKSSGPIRKNLPTNQEPPQEPVQEPPPPPAPRIAPDRMGEGEDSRIEDNPEAAAGTQLVSKLKGPMRGSQRQELEVLAERLLTAGWGFKELTRELTTDLNGVRSYFGVYRKRMHELTNLVPVADPTSVAPAPAVAARSCRVDCQDGQLVCSGDCSADCSGTHEPRGSACPQCHSTNRKATSAAESLVDAILDAHRVPMSRRAAPTIYRAAQGSAQRLLDAGVTPAEITEYVAQQGSLETTKSPVGDLAEWLHERGKALGGRSKRVLARATG